MELQTWSICNALYIHLSLNQLPFEVFFFHSVILTEYVAIKPRVCVSQNCVCVSSLQPEEMNWF